MAILLQTIIDGYTSPIKERDGLPYSRIAFIDPESLYTPQGSIPAVYQDRSVLTPEAVNLYERIRAISGLFFNSAELKKVAGEHMVVGIGALERAIKEIPDEPVSLDVFPFDKTYNPGPLVNFHLERASDLVPFLTMHIEFNDTPEWDSSSEMIMLRDNRIAERMKPLFYQQEPLPKGIGRLDSEGWRAGPSPLFGILRVAPANEYRISISAVSFIDRYVSAALNDPYTFK